MKSKISEILDVSTESIDEQLMKLLEIAEKESPKAKVIFENKEMRITRQKTKDSPVVLVKA